VTEDIYGKILKELEEKGEKGNLPQILKFYQDLLRIQSGVELKIASLLEPSLSSEAIAARQERGLPLIRFDELALDWPLLRDTFSQVIAVFAKYPELFGEIPERLKAPKAGRLLTKKALKAWFEGDELPPSLATGDVNQNILRAMIQAAMRPFLTSHARTLTSSISQEHWRRSHCPICGGSPDFAYLEQEVGARWLLCSRCDTEWLFQRLECPYCGAQDPKSLAYLTDDEGLYRLYTCDQCKRYLKTIDLRQAKTEVLLPLERFYTLDMDSQAREQGYSP
jgi:FdhE protein